MSWGCAPGKLRESTALGLAILAAACVAYLYLPNLLDGAVLALGALASAAVIIRPVRSWYQPVVVVACFLVPVAFVRIEAEIFEMRVRAHLPEFEIAARGLLAGKRGSCWTEIPSPTDCSAEQLPPIVRRMAVDVRSESESITFIFKKGTRRFLLYTPLPQRGFGSSRVIAPGWHLSRG